MGERPQIPRPRNHLKAKKSALRLTNTEFVVGLNHGVVLFRHLAEILTKVLLQN